MTLATGLIFNTPYPCLSKGNQKSAAILPVITENKRPDIRLRRLNRQHKTLVS
jgi:hypothetical protein